MPKQMQFYDILCGKWTKTVNLGVPHSWTNLYTNHQGIRVPVAIKQGANRREEARLLYGDFIGD